MTHTATPWKVIKTSDTKIVRQGNEQSTIGIWSKDECIDIAYLRVGMASRVNESNAEFIVKAVNSHEALVEACKSLEQFETTPDKDVVTISYKAIQRAREALKLAGEL